MRLGLHTQNAVAALQLEGLLVAAQLVDEVAQLLHVLEALRHHHLLVHQVGLGQVSPGLQAHTHTRIQLQTPDNNL